MLNDMLLFTVKERIALSIKEGLPKLPVQTCCIYRKGHLRAEVQGVAYVALCIAGVVWVASLDCWNDCIWVSTAGDLR